jgi:transcriptional regulator with XRE-family HTH domain
MSEQELNSIIAKKINYYMELNGTTQNELAEYMGVSQATISNWQKGVKTPRMSKIDKICDFFHIQRSDLMEDKSTKEDASYYINPETQQIAQEIFDNEDLKMLFDTTRDCSPEDMKKVISMVKAFKGEL